MAQSVQRLITNWMLRESNPGGEGRFSTPFHIDPGTHPAACKVHTGSSPGIERPGRGLDQITATSAEVKEKIWVYLL